MSTPPLSWARIATMQPPMLVSADPAIGAVGVDINAIITLVFNKPVKLMFATITFRKVGAFDKAFVLTHGAHDNTLILTPVGPLDAASGYTLGGSFYDTADHMVYWGACTNFTTAP